VQVAPEPLPHDQDVIDSPVIVVDPSNTSSFTVADDPPPVVTCVQALSGLHKYRFCPLAALVLKNASPVEHVPGSAVPALIGFVDRAPDASQLPTIVRLPVVVLCP
jgi:hypothetical protein